MRTGKIGYLVTITVSGRVTEGIQLLLGLSHQRIQSRLHIRQLVTNVVHEDLVEGPGEVLSTVLVSNVSVCSVASEELALTVKSIFHVLVRIDILLATVDHTDKA